MSGRCSRRTSWSGSRRRTTSGYRTIRGRRGRAITTRCTSSNSGQRTLVSQRMNVMTRNRSTWMVTAALVLVGAGLSAQTTPAQLSENRIQELIRQAAERVANGQTTVQPGGGTGQTTQTTPAAGDTRPVVRMTLDDAVKAALDHNLDIAVQRLSPAINDIYISSIRSVFYPAL